MKIQRGMLEKRRPEKFAEILLMDLACFAYEVTKIFTNAESKGEYGLKKTERNIREKKTRESCRESDDILRRDIFTNRQKYEVI